MTAPSLKTEIASLRPTPALAFGPKSENPPGLVYRTREPFEFKSGECLPSIDITYETWGELDEDRANAVLIFTGLSPSAHAASSENDPSPGWWEDMIGPGAPIDTDRFFVICLNHLGGCFGSTGPSSINPATGKRYGIEFPSLTMEDMANAGWALLDGLGVETAEAVVGPSMGGLTALAFALEHPNALRRLLLISSAARMSARGIAIHGLQREAIVNDPAWLGGNYELDRPPVQGMKLARKIGMSSYRSADEWAHRFGNTKTDRWGRGAFGIEFEVLSYLEAVAQKFVRKFDANSYLYLTRAMDLFDAAHHGADLECAMTNLQVKGITVVGVDSDALFPIQEQCDLAAALRDAGHDVRLEAVNSDKGHDAFLVDMERFQPVIRRFFSAT